MTDFFEKPRSAETVPSPEGVEQQKLIEQIASEAQVFGMNMDEAVGVASNVDENRLNEEQKGSFARLKEWTAEWGQRREAWGQYYGTLDDTEKMLASMTMGKPGGFAEFLLGKVDDPKYGGFEAFLKSFREKSAA